MNVTGQRIKHHRQAKGLSQGELTKGIITIHMLDLIEQGKGKPSERVLEALAKRLDVSVEELKGRPDDKKGS